MLSALCAALNSSINYIIRILKLRQVFFDRAKRAQKMASKIERPYDHSYIHNTALPAEHCGPSKRAHRAPSYKSYICKHCGPSKRAHRAPQRA